MPRIRSSRLALPFVATTLLASLPALGAAQAYYRREVQDYDQRRDPLPKNGSMYCVPTSYVDLLRFMALNGFKNLDQGYDGGYGSITDFIRMLGDRMGTDPDPDGGGTSFSNGFDVIEEWMDDHASHGFYHYAYVSEDDWGLTTMKYWMSLGAMIRLGYGRYYKVGNEWVRDGGHSIAMAG